MRTRLSPFETFVAAMALAISLRASLQSVAVRRLPASVATDARHALENRSALGRTADDTAGRGATTPSNIPARGWWAILKRTVFKFSDNELMAEAAGVTFYALLSIFPAIAALISLYGLVADPKTISDHLETASGFLPGGGMDIIKEQVQRLTQNPASGLGLGAILGIATALWSANQGSKAIFSALNNVYDEKEKRSFFKLTVITLAFTAGALVFIIVMMGTVIVLPIVLNFIGLESATDTLVRVGRWPAVLVLLAMFLALLYRIGPSRETARWRWISWGSALAALLWIALSIGFSWYVAHFGSYNKTYGSLGAVVGFMTWIWLSTTVILLGAQLNAEMELQTARDTTTGPDKPMGARGAMRANHVA